MRHLESAIVVVIVTLLLTPLAVAGQEVESLDGGWNFVLNRDEMTDEPNPYVFTQATDRAGLAFSCARGFTVMVMPEDLMLSDRRDRVRVQWRVDDGEPSDEKHWQASSMRAAHVQGDQARALFRTAAQGSELRVRIIDRRTSQNMTYNVEGVRNAVSRLPCAPE